MGQKTICPPYALYRMDDLNPNPNSGKDGCVQGIGHATGRIDPKGRKWVIINQRSSPYFEGVKWECDTDVEIHLFAYVSPRPPKKKRGTHVKRGVVFQHAAEVYWSYKDIVCQLEPGFTTHHTFIFYCYCPEPYLWWRCGGRTTQWVWPFQPIWSASRSSFYHWKCSYPPPPEPYCFDTCDPINHWTTNASHKRAINFQPCTNFVATELGACVSRWGDIPPFPHTILQLYTMAGDGTPGTLLSETHPLWTFIIPSTPPTIIRGSITPVTLFADQQYCFALVPEEWIAHPNPCHLQWHVGIDQNCTLLGQRSRNYFNDPGWVPIAGEGNLSMHIGGHLPE